MASRVENGIEIVSRKQVALAFERAAAKAWESWTPDESISQEPMLKPLNYNPRVRRLEETTNKYSGSKHYLELITMAVGFAGVHLVAQRTEGLFLAAGVMFALPLAKEMVPFLSQPLDLVYHPFQKIQEGRKIILLRVKDFSPSRPAASG